MDQQLDGDHKVLPLVNDFDRRVWLDDFLSHNRTKLLLDSSGGVYDHLCVNTLVSATSPLLSWVMALSSFCRTAS